MINLGITSPIPVGTNSNITSGDIFTIPPRDLSKIPEDTYATFYNSMSSAPTNPNVKLVKPDPKTYVKSNSDSVSKTTITLPVKLSNSKIRQQICSCIFNNKQELKDIKKYNGNEKNWRKAKENWTAAISAAHCDFKL